MNLNNLIKDAYEIAKEKGWHDDPVSFPDYIANIHAELSEAWEEWRNNRGLNEVYYTCERDYECGLYEPHGINQECMGCSKHKPCGIPFELADVVIRICDMFGELKITEEELSNQYLFYSTSDEFGRFITNCHSEASLSFDNYRLSYTFSRGLILTIEYFCKENGIDLEQAIELKMAYNRTRPYRHNGKRV
jgi:hypothetical protein